jgi:hypothetical protein
LKIPKKTLDRIQANLKQYQLIALNHKTKDVSEADTVTLVKDVLAYCFGFDKYEELTSEQQIRGTFCDLAVKIDGKIRYLIEVKAAGVTLSDSHLRQALNYGANAGIEWIVLTNGLDWRLYRIKFGQPINFEEVSSFHLPSINTKNEDDIQRLFLLCREGLGSDAMGVFHQHAQIVNRFTIAQIVLTEPVIAAVKKELKRLFPEVKIDPIQLSDIMRNDVLKREVIEGDKATEMHSRVKRISNKIAKQNERKENASLLPSPAAVSSVDPSVT